MQLRFTVVERNQINKILSEQNLSITDFVDDNVVKYGKLIGVDTLILGSVSVGKVGGGSYVDLKKGISSSSAVKEGIGSEDIKFIDVNTGALIGGIKFENGIY